MEESIQWFEEQCNRKRRHLRIHACVPNSDSCWYEVQEWTERDYGGEHNQRWECKGDGLTVQEAIEDMRGKESVS